MSLCTVICVGGNLLGDICVFMQTVLCSTIWSDGFPLSIFSFSVVKPKLLITHQSLSIPLCPVNDCSLCSVSHFSRLKPLDIAFMKAAHHKVNIVPVIAKADTLTKIEVQKMKRKVQPVLLYHWLSLDLECVLPYSICNSVFLLISRTIVVIMLCVMLTDS